MSQRPLAAIERKGWTYTPKSQPSDFPAHHSSHKRPRSVSSSSINTGTSSNGRVPRDSNYSDDGDEGYGEGGSDKNGNTDSPVKFDRYGFYVSDSQSKGLSDDMARLSLVEITRKREIKWLFMFQRWDEFIHKRWKKLRKRCRKGIPDSVRGRAWFYLCAGHKQKQRNPNLFSQLEKHPGDEKINEEIRKDLNRQFPSHEMFAEENGPGQEDLYRILKAFSVVKPEIGYCQGQAPLASVLLMQMPAEDAFWCLLQICDHYVPGYFSPGLEAIQLHGLMLSSFVKRFYPPIYRLLKKHKIDPVLYMTEWFMCFFARTLKWSCVLRIWDMFFCEGIVVVFKVALILISSVLGRSEERAKCVSAYEVLYALKNIPAKYLTEEYLIEKVINFDLTEQNLSKEFKEQKIKRKKEKERLAQERQRAQSRSSMNMKHSTGVSGNRNSD